MDLIAEQVEYASRYGLKHHHNDFSKALVAAQEKLSDILDRKLNTAELREVARVIREIADWRAQPSFCHNLAVG